MDMDQRAIEIEAFVQSHLIDKDGIVYSMINETTKQPLHERDIGENVKFTYIGAPSYLWKAAFFSYEDSDMATAEYMLANIYRYKTTKDKVSQGVAKRCFKALQRIAEAGAKNRRDVVMPAFGFLPKPYGGIKTAHLSSETSVDQYMRTMYALLIYRETLANKKETAWIKTFLAACADCWALNNYTFKYFGTICRWACYAPHSVAFGLFCAAVGQHFGSKIHDYWFNIFLSRTDTFEKKVSGPEAGLVILAAKILCQYKPLLSQQWHHYSKKALNSAFAVLDKRGYTTSSDFISHNKGYRGWDKTPHRYWQFLSWHGDIRLPETQLAAACVDYYEMCGQRKFLSVAHNLLNMHGTSGYIKWIQPQSRKDIPKGYEILGNLISGLNTAAWLRTYWQLRYLSR